MWLETVPISSFCIEYYSTGIRIQSIHIVNFNRKIFLKKYRFMKFTIDGGGKFVIYLNKYQN